MPFGLWRQREVPVLPLTKGDSRECHHLSHSHVVTNARAPLLSGPSGADVMDKYRADMPINTKRLRRFRETLTAKSNWAIMAMMNLLWEKSNDRSLLAIQEQKDERNRSIDEKRNQ